MWSLLLTILLVSLVIFLYLRRNVRTYTFTLSLPRPLPLPPIFPLTHALPPTHTQTLSHTHTQSSSLSLSLSLLTEPSDPQDAEVANMYLSNYERFASTARWFLIFLLHGDIFILNNFFALSTTFFCPIICHRYIFSFIFHQRHSSSQVDLLRLKSHSNLTVFLVHRFWTESYAMPREDVKGSEVSHVWFVRTKRIR